MKKYVVLLLCMLTLSTLIACTAPVSGDVIKSDKQRAVAGNPSGNDVSSLVNDNTGFAIDLYQVLAGKSGNLFFSPYSISEVLAMAYAGAAGNTATQMAKALHFNLASASLHGAFNTLDQELRSRGKDAKGKDDKPFRLNLVNATWGQKDFTFVPAFLDTLAQYYGADIRLLNFKDAPEDSRVTINNWVAGQTENRIKDLIAKGMITPLTRLVLTNAIYFNAAWQIPFTKESTSNGTFKKPDGQTSTVQMMHGSKFLKYGESSDYQAVELPYSGQELSMIVVLPKGTKLNEFNKSLTAAKLTGIIGSLSQRQVSLSLPKFKTESSFSLNDALSSMGMIDAFTDKADFSSITGKKDLYISQVVHKTFVVVDEAGTEAAAASAVIMGLTAMPIQPVVMTVDSPFIFLIKDKTGTILFMGQIVNPEM
jgi:serpin B